MSPRRRRSAASTPRAAATHRVTLFHAEGCHLCDRALAVVREAQERETFELELVDIAGVEPLEAAYREHLPVIEIDGERAFTYFVTVDGLLERLRRDGSREHPAAPAGNM